MTHGIRCPECKTLLKMSVVVAATKEQEILEVLAGRADRIIYKGAAGGLFFTNLGPTMPELNEKMIAGMIKSGALVHKYPDHSEGYCLPGQEYKGNI